MRRALLLLLVLPLAACGSGSDQPDASIDSSVLDSPAPKDQSVVDAPADSKVDAGTDAGADAAVDAPSDALEDSAATDAGSCSVSDCRLFSSYCSTAPCKCIPLKKSDPNPPCNGGTVTCLVDPCNGKTAACSDAGTCATSP